LDSVYVRLFILAVLLLVIVFSTVPQSSGKFSRPVVLSEQGGYSLQQSREGLPVIISKTFLNAKDIVQEFIVIFDIRKDDVSLTISLQAGVAQPVSQTTTSFSWMPEMPGEYQIRALVLSNLTIPEILENVLESRFSVMSNDDFMALYSDRTTSFTIKSVDPVPASPTVPSFRFNDMHYLASGSNVHTGDISTSNNGLYLIGRSEVPPLRENPPQSGGNELIFFAAIGNAGTTIEPMRYLINNSRALIFTRDPMVHAVNDTLVYASWLQQAPYRDEFKLVVIKSMDGGKSFSSKVNVDVSAVAFGNHDTAISKDGKNLYKIWTEIYQYPEPEPLKGAVVFSKSNDYAQSFAPKQVILNYTGNEMPNCAQIAIQEAPNNSSYANDVYLAWRQNSGDNRIKLFVSASHDNGETFSQPIMIREAYTEENDCAWLAAYGDDVYVSWSETRLIGQPENPSEILVGDSDLFFVASRDGGRSFESPVNLSEGIGAQTIEPEMLVSEGRIYAVWRDTIPEVYRNGRVNYYGNAEVIMTRSLDGGRTFEKPVNLSNNTSGSYEPEIAVSGDKVYVAWMESNFPSNEAKASFRISNDAGETFSETLDRVFGTMPEPFSRPQILVSPDGDEIYFVWSQRTADVSTIDICVLVAKVV
jgi:hypothetical protein